MNTILTEMVKKELVGMSFSELDRERLITYTKVKILNKETIHFLELQASKQLALAEYITMINEIIGLDRQSIVGIRGFTQVCSNERCTNNPTNDTDYCCYNCCHTDYQTDV